MAAANADIVKNAGRRTVSQAANAANAASAHAEKAAGHVNKNIDKLNDAQAVAVERLVKLGGAGADTMPPKLKMVMGKVPVPGYFTLFKECCASFFCMCLCPAYYQKHIMEAEHDEWEEDRRKNYHGVKVEELNSAMMQNVVHEQIGVSAATGALLREGCEANLEICLYPFDGQVDGWPHADVGWASRHLAEGMP